MNQSTACPDRSLLGRYLNEDAALENSSGWSREQLERHVNECETCQQLIERLVAGGETWEGTAKQLEELERRQSATPHEAIALRELIEREKDRLPDEFESSASRNEKEDLDQIPLDFLQPSDQSDSRGRLGSYEILEVVGRGGMGLVLKAYDTSLRRIVAIKVMAAHLATSSLARRRFVREARAAAAVSHDHVVAIYAVEENNDPPFLVMQFVNGKTLQERLVASGPLALNEVLRIGTQTASGLAAAHAQGLVHRDIKPANILLENGVERVKITDFGLARAVDDVSMTRTGIVAGTPQFMAPEQANGEAIDVRSDLFSLGSVLYTLCAGRPPFRATTTMGLLKRICDETPRPIRDINTDVPEWLEAIITKLLKKSPNERYQTSSEVAELLENWLAHVQRPMTMPAPNPVNIAKKSTPESKPSEPQSDFIHKLSEDAQRGSQKLPWWGDDYVHSLPFAGDIETTFDLADATLSTVGLKIAGRTNTELTVTGPGFARRTPLGYVSKIRLIRDTDRLQLRANLAPLRLILGAAGGLIAVVPIIFLEIARRSRPYPDPDNPLAVTYLIAAMWLGGCLLSAVFLRKNIRKAFDDFLFNLVIAGMNRHSSDPNSAPSSNTAKTISLPGWWPDDSLVSLSTPFLGGDVARAFDFAVAFLTGNDFTLEHRTPTRLRFTGSVTSLLGSTSLKEASWIEIDSENASLNLNTHIRLIRFTEGLILFAISLLAALVYSFFFLFSRTQPVGSLIVTCISFACLIVSVRVSRHRKLKKLFEQFLTKVVNAGLTNGRSQIGPILPAVGPISTNGAAAFPSNRWYSNRTRYVRSADFHGNFEKSSDFAMAYLITNGFILQQRSAARLKLIGQGPPLIQMNPLDSVYSMEFSRDTDRIAIDATLQSIPILDGVAFAFLSVIVTPTICYRIVLNNGQFVGDIQTKVIAFASCVMALFAVFLISRLSYRRRRKALDILFQNVVMVGTIDDAVQRTNASGSPLVS